MTVEYLVNFIVNGYNVNIGSLACGVRGITVGKVKLKPLKLLPSNLKKKVTSYTEGRGMAKVNAILKDLKDSRMVAFVLSSFNFPVWSLKKLDGFWSRLLKTQSCSSPNCIFCARHGVFLEQINTASGMQVCSH